MPHVSAARARARDGPRRPHSARAASDSAPQEGPAREAVALRAAGLSAADSGNPSEPHTGGSAGLDVLPYLPYGFPYEDDPEHRQHRHGPAQARGGPPGPHDA